MITNSLGGLIIFTESLAKTLIHKGVFEKSELVKQLEEMRSGRDHAPGEQVAAAAEIDMMITRVNNL